MKVKIVSIDGDKCVIDTKFGLLNAIAKDKFEIGKDYYVEVDFQDIVNCDKQLFSDDNKEYIIADGGNYIVNAEFLTAGDGILTVMLDKGLVSIDATNLVVLENARHKFVKFKVSKILIYNEDIPADFNVIEKLG